MELPRWYPVQSVRDFQKAHGLLVDGKAGPNTWAKVFELSERVEDLESQIDTKRLRRYSFGGQPLKDGIDRHPGHLLPGFADNLETLFRRMRERGFDPILFEGFRSLARAQELANEGSGIARSMHCYGAAADIIDRTRWWSAPSDFWQSLGEIADSLGLTWGGHWPRDDFAHVQAVRVSEQDEFRSMTDEQRARRVQESA